MDAVWPPSDRARVPTVLSPSAALPLLEQRFIQCAELAAKLGIGAEHDAEGQSAGPVAERLRTARCRPATAEPDREIADRRAATKARTALGWSIARPTHLPARGTVFRKKRSSSGISFTQGGHQVAQKLSSRGCPRNAAHGQRRRPPGALKFRSQTLGIVAAARRLRWPLPASSPAPDAAERGADAAAPADERGLRRFMRSSSAARAARSPRGGRPLASRAQRAAQVVVVVGCIRCSADGLAQLGAAAATGSARRPARRAARTVRTS